MKKTILTVVAALLMTAMTYAEDKIAYINSQAVFADMPELKDIQKSLEDEQAKYKGEMELMEKEYENKVMAYKEQEATMSDAMKQTRQSEIADLEQRYNTFLQTVRQELQKKQEELMTPLYDKIKKAIEDVGKEKGYTYIIDEASQAIVYHSASAIDAEPFVRTKLGLKPAVK